MWKFLILGLFLLKNIHADPILKVEGALARPFRLWLSLKESGPKLNPSQKEIWQNLLGIIQRDLEISGNFSLINPENINKNNDEILKAFGVEGFSKIDVSFLKSELVISIHNKNLINKKNNLIKVKDTLLNARKLAHKISHSIFNEFIGEENLFLLEIAAVKKNKDVHQIVLLDFDGSNEKNISEGKFIKSSPSFTPNGKSILYTMILPDGHAIVEQEIGKPKLNYLSKKNGLNMEAKAFPDNQHLLATLSLGKNANIYKLDKKGNILHPLFDTLGLNLSPSLDSTGTKMAFVSTRSGNPQIYLADLKDAKQDQKRLTFQGNYNQTPNISPDGKFIAFTGRDEKNVFDIFIIEVASGKISRITQNQGRNQEPVFTPSGRYLVFSSSRNGHKSELYLATLNGSHQVRLTYGGDYLSPTFRPLSL